MTMGTASTMTAIAEALGMCLSGSSSIPAPDANHKRMSAETGRRAVELVNENLCPTDIITSASVQNALHVAMASGCSTNAIIHLIAMARRAGVPMDLSAFDTASKDVPVLANVRPTGDTYLMEDFYYAGGLPALMKKMAAKLNLTAKTIDGTTVAENIEKAECYNDDVIRSLDNPVYHEGSLAVLKGNLAPDGAVMKPAAAEARLHVHKGPAIVFDSYEDMKAAVDDETLDVSADHVMIFRNAGPVGGPGMPEWGMMQIPTKLVKQGVRDMLRISDARMSGTSYGACILHVAPESYIGGPLALVQTGDIIEVNIPERSLNMLVDETELARRKAAWVAPEPSVTRGYQWMSAQHIQQADKGCDFDFLETSFGKTAGEPDIF
jgi:dihydroxy-acid dehydratase